MKQSFNENWICYKTGDKENAFAVTLPHDAMQLDERSETSAGGVNTGWYEAQDYTYEKTFILPEKAKDEKDKSDMFQFHFFFCPFFVTRLRVFSMVCWFFWTLWVC